MTREEQKTVTDLIKIVTDLKVENSKFRDDIKSLVEIINNKTDKKHVPITLEKDILTSAQIAIQDSIVKVLNEYNSPLRKLVESVVNENRDFLRQIISDSFNSVIRTNDFKESIVNAFSHKVARSIISNNDGLFDKVSNELKQDSIFKSKMAVAVSNVVEECLKKT